MPPGNLGPDEIRLLVQVLGEARGALHADSWQITQLRRFFGQRVLPPAADAYILRKYHLHVEEDQHWPDDTTSEEFLESLRETVLDRRSAIYLTDAVPEGEWSIYFVGRVRRVWHGSGGSDRVLVIFNAEHHRFVTGFQPDDGDDYVERQGGFWLIRT